jgi:hypothetical protein
MTSIAPKAFEGLATVPLTGSPDLLSDNAPKRFLERFVRVGYVLP